MKKISDPNLLQKLEGKQKPASAPSQSKRTQPVPVTDKDLIEKLEHDNKRLNTVNNLMNNALDVKVVEVPFKVHIPVVKEVIKEVPVEKIVEKIVEKPVEKIVEKIVKKVIEKPKIVHKYVEVPVAIQQPKQNVKRETTEKITIKNNKISKSNRVSTLKKLDDLLDR